MARLGRSGSGDIAPDLFTYETLSVLRNRVYRKEITQSEAGEALRILASLDITYYQPAAIRQSTSELARRFNRSTADDAFYLALAQDENSPLWTGDNRLYNAVKDQIKWFNLGTLAKRTSEHLDGGPAVSLLTI